ncbi:uncharacterized protein LOC6499664 isoform X3 [Drosophila ananassae]|uniref:uncharacterized protein LOC6499664 isoform X3 n=1 Tax=Drosophila ananassae TaxID=7217 RepID=UPI0013A5F2A5|nr:uncharacterized protein LOC6499664 isoform X3 [Drosophila ananassae]
MDSKGTQTEKKSGKIRKSNQKGRITLPDEVPLHHQNEPVVTESQAESEHRPSNNEPVYSCGFEVFGIVQGVSFRMPKVFFSEAFFTLLFNSIPCEEPRSWGSGAGA